MISPFKMFKLWMIERSLKALASKGVKMETGEIKEGWKTTEFWLTLLAQAPAIIAMTLGTSSKLALGLSAICTIVYTLARTWHKAGSANLGTVALAAATAAAEAAKKLPLQEDGPSTAGQQPAQPS